MRVLHLGFQLNCPIAETEAAREAAFCAKNQQVYQPFFAFLERNVQKYPEFRISLMVPGMWLELAERFDPELIVRLKKIAMANKIDFLATPYYNSLAFFYDRAEFEAEMWLQKEKMRDLFDAICRVCAFPDLMYNDVLAIAAEKMGYIGVLAGGMPEDMTRRYENRVYDAAKCRQVRVLWRNTGLSEFLATDFGVLAKEAKMPDLLTKFRKQIELSAMRGGVINLFLDAEVFARQREAGVIKFLDEFLAEWLGRPENPLATATDLAMIGGVENEVSLKKTTSWRRGQEDLAREKPGLVSLKEIETRPPVWLDSKTQRKVLTELYELKPEVFRTEDEELIAEFCGLTALERVYAMSEDVVLRGQVLGKISKTPREAADEILAKIEELRARVAEIWREKQAEIERREVKVQKKAAPKEEEMVATEESAEVKINFGNVKRAKGGVASDEQTVMKVVPEDNEVRSVLVEQVKEETAEADDFQVEVKITEKETPVRRILKKIVIE